MITRLETLSSGGVAEHVSQYLPDPITGARVQRFWRRRAVHTWRRQESLHVLWPQLGQRQVPQPVQRSARLRTSRISERPTPKPLPRRKRGERRTAPTRRSTSVVPSPPASPPRSQPGADAELCGDAFCGGEMRRQELSGSVQCSGRFVKHRGIGLEDVGHPRGDVERDLHVGGGGLSREANGVVEENLVTSGLDDRGRQAGQVGEYGTGQAKCCV